MLKDRVIGVNISVDRTQIGVADAQNNVLAKESFQNGTYAEEAAYATVLCEHITTLMEQNGGVERFRGIGISAPNANHMTGRVENPVNLPWSGSNPVRALLQDRFGIAVTIANKAATAAYYERRLGLARGMWNFIVVTLDHGIGSCIYANGYNLMGENGYAGELGHVCIIPDGRRCKCGRKGCLEAYAGAEGIVTTARELMAANEQQTLMRSLDTMTPQTILDCCEKGDEMAIEVYRQTGSVLGIALAGYASLINPEAIILKGRIAQAGDYLLQPLRQSFDDHVFRSIMGGVKILVAPQSDDHHAVLAASLLAWESKEYSLFK